MENTENEESGYERYDKIITFIESQCDESNCVGTIGKSGGDMPKKHYLLFDRLHVYIDDDEITICDSELYCNDGNLNFQDFSYYSQEKIKYSLGKNRRLENCKLYFWAPERVKPGIRISYYKNSVYYDDVGEYVKDSCFLPANLDPYSGNRIREEGYYSELLADMSILLERAMLYAENEETKNAYRDALDFHNRVIKIANRDKKEITVEFWLRRLKQLQTSTLHSRERVECEQEISKIMKTRGQHRTPQIAIDKDEIEQM